MHSTSPPGGVRVRHAAPSGGARVYSGAATHCAGSSHDILRMDLLTRRQSDPRQVHTLRHASRHTLRHASRHTLRHASHHTLRHASRHTLRHTSRPRVTSTRQRLGLPRSSLRALRRWVDAPALHVHVPHNASNRLMRDFALRARLAQDVTCKRTHVALNP